MKAAQSSYFSKARFRGAISIPRSRLAQARSQYQQRRNSSTT